MGLSAVSFEMAGRLIFFGRMLKKSADKTPWPLEGGTDYGGGDDSGWQTDDDETAEAEYGTVRGICGENGSEIW